jgi:2-haloacid dehalogenase
MRLNLTTESEKQLMDQYAKLTGFVDSLTVLKALKEKGLFTAILSNGSGEMLTTVVDSNGLMPTSIRS